MVSRGHSVFSGWRSTYLVLNYNIRAIQALFEISNRVLHIVDAFQRTFVESTYQWSTNVTK
jgi:hypothetical protein